MPGLLFLEKVRNNLIFICITKLFINLNLMPFYLSLTIGIVKFHQVAISEVEVGPDSSPEETLNASGSLLEHYVQSVRESLGVELQTSNVLR